MVKPKKICWEIFKEKKILYYKKKYRNRVYHVKTLALDDSYNILEYYGIIRKYLQWKYKLSLQDLELLYYLYPRNYFTKAEFDNFPVYWNNSRMKDLINNNFIDSVFPERKKFIVYRLSKKGKTVVRMAHQLLSGEIKIPTNNQSNLCFKGNATYSQTRFRNIMKEMRELVGEKFDYRNEE